MIANPDSAPAILATRTIVSLSLIDFFTRVAVQRQFRPCSTSNRDIDAMALASETWAALSIRDSSIFISIRPAGYFVFNKHRVVDAQRPEDRLERR